MAESVLQCKKVAELRLLMHVCEVRVLTHEPNDDLSQRFAAFRLAGNGCNRRWQISAVPIESAKPLNLNNRNSRKPCLERIFRVSAR